MAGYSKTPLVKKLGIKARISVLFINEPKDYIKIIQPLPTDIKIKHEISGSFSFIQLFTKSQEELRELFPKLKNALEKNGMLWISWPKGACGVGLTDINENIVRDIGLQNGLVDVKVIAVDEEWSGLKFVYRLVDRK